MNVQPESIPETDGWDLTAQLPTPHVPCRCDEHKYGQRPGVGAVLYSGPDAVLLLERAAIRDGRYEDAIAYADERMSLLHAKCEAAVLQTRRTLEPAWLVEQRFQAAKAAAGTEAA